METHEDQELIPATALRSAAAPMPADARHAVRGRVMEAVRAERRPGFLVTHTQRVAAVMTTLTLLGGGVAYAANGSLPGSALYPVKRAAEDALVAVLPAGDLEHDLLVRLAERRAAEAGELSRREGARHETMTGALEDLRASVEHAGAGAALEERELLRIRSHAGEVPSWASDAIDDAVMPQHRSGTGDDTGTRGGAPTVPSGNGTGSGTGGSDGMGTGGGEQHDGTGTTDPGSGGGTNGGNSGTDGTPSGTGGSSTVPGGDGGVQPTRSEQPCNP